MVHVFNTGEQAYASSTLWPWQGTQNASSNLHLWFLAFLPFWLMIYELCLPLDMLWTILYYHDPPGIIFQVFVFKPLPTGLWENWYQHNIGSYYSQYTSTLIQTFRWHKWRVPQEVVNIWLIAILLQVQVYGVVATHWLGNNRRPWDLEMKRGDVAIFFDCDPGMGWKLVSVLPVCCTRDDSDVATGMNFGVTSSSSWSNSVCNPKLGITRIRGLSKTTTSFQSWTPRTAVDKPVCTKCWAGMEVNAWHQ